MKYFFDTSAFVKFYKDEIGTEKVTKIILDKQNHIMIMELVCLEFTSALFRRFKNKEITEDELSNIISKFEFDSPYIFIEPFTNQILYEASRLLYKYGKNYGLRTLDSLHLATCYLLSDNDLFFVCADEILCNVARELNINFINPTV